LLFQATRLPLRRIFILQRRRNGAGRKIHMYVVLEKIAEIISVMAVPAAMIAMLAWGFAFGSW
jgi:hypothetical protein